MNLLFTVNLQLAFRANGFSLLQAVSNLATSVEKDKSELPKFDKEIQESEVTF